MHIIDILVWIIYAILYEVIEIRVLFHFIEFISFWIAKIYNFPEQIFISLISWLNKKKFAVFPKPAPCWDIVRKGFNTTRATKSVVWRPDACPTRPSLKSEKVTCFIICFSARVTFKFHSNIDSKNLFSLRK